MSAPFSKERFFLERNF